MAFHIHRSFDLEHLSDRQRDEVASFQPTADCIDARSAQSTSTPSHGELGPVFSRLSTSGNMTLERGFEASEGAYDDCPNWASRSIQRQGQLSLFAELPLILPYPWTRVWHELSSASAVLLTFRADHLSGYRYRDTSLTVSKGSSRDNEPDFIGQTTRIH